MYCVRWGADPFQTLRGYTQRARARRPGLEKIVGFLQNCVPVVEMVLLIQTYMSYRSEAREWRQEQNRFVHERLIQSTSSILPHSWTHQRAAGDHGMSAPTLQKDIPKLLADTISYFDQQRLQLQSQSRF